MSLLQELRAQEQSLEKMKVQLSKKEEELKKYEEKVLLREMALNEKMKEMVNKT